MSSDLLDQVWAALFPSWPHCQELVSLRSPECTPGYAADDAARDLLSSPVKTSRTSNVIFVFHTMISNVNHTSSVMIWNLLKSKLKCYIYVLFSIQMFDIFIGTDLKLGICEMDLTIKERSMIKQTCMNLSQIYKTSTISYEYFLYLQIIEQIYTWICSAK